MSFENGKPFTVDIYGIMEDVEPKNGKDFKSDELHEICRCDMVQVVYVHRNYGPQLNGRPWELWLDEEGKLKENAMINQFASHLYHNPNDLIVGKVLVCPPGYVK